MAIGAISSGDSDISVSVTGVAGPNGGTIEKPVGLVHISVARKNFEILHEKHLQHSPTSSTNGPNNQQTKILPNKITNPTNPAKNIGFVSIQ